ncbi:MAG: hypothetical protein RLN81_04760 [Balneolaceae bacterium]
MNTKDRQIQLFLQIFLALTGIYIITVNVWRLNLEIWDQGIFEFYNGEIPVFKVSAGFITGTTSLIASALLWMRVSLAHAFAILCSGLLFSYNLVELGEVISSNPYHAIPMVFILIVVLQSFPFLIRRTSRHL